MIGELWTSCIWIRSGTSCKKIVGDQFDRNYEYSPLKSRLYIDIDEDDEPSLQSSALGSIFCSMESLFFSILDL